MIQAFCPVGTSSKWYLFSYRYGTQLLW